MAITTAMCTSFKVECFKGVHNFSASGGHALKVALIKASETGTYGAASTNYSNITGNSDETSGTNYTSGGAALTNIEPTSSGTTALCDFSDVQWASADFSANGAMIYNTNAAGNQSISIHDFGGTKTASGGNFDLQMPTADASNAILRLA